MIGLEYICKLYDKQYKDVAEELGVTKQLVSIWIKEKKPIPKKHLPKLSEIFGGLKEEYFQKEINLDINILKSDSKSIEENIVDTYTKGEINMIGLEYILKLWNITQQELADRLGIKRQNIDAWIRKQRPIPKKYLPVLSEIFNISEEYFQKELTKDLEILILGKRIEFLKTN